MRDWVLKLLERVNSNWTTYMTSTSLFFMLVLFSQQNINVQTLFSVWFELSSSRWDFWEISKVLYWIFIMGFYFYGWYIYTDGDKKKKLNLICMRQSCVFKILMIVMDKRSVKVILKLSLVILFGHLNRSVAIPKWDWLEKLLMAKRHP